MTAPDGRRAVDLLSAAEVRRLVITVLTDYVAEHGEISDDPDDIAGAATAVWSAIGIEEPTTAPHDVAAMVREALTRLGAHRAPLVDAEFAAQTTWVTRTLELVDQAMDREGIGAATRLRVLRRVLHGGEPPFEALAAVTARINTRRAGTERLADSAGVIDLRWFTDPLQSGANPVPTNDQPGSGSGPGTQDRLGD